MTHERLLKNFIMQKEIDLIQKHAKELRNLEQNEQHLFDHLNALSKSEIETLINEFSSVRSDTRLQPVNLLRFDILNLLKEGTQVSSEAVENIKTKIIEKNEGYFSKYGDTLVNALNSYPQKKKSPFVNWQRDYCIFFPFFYTNIIKEETSSL